MLISVLMNFHVFLEFLLLTETSTTSQPSPSMPQASSPRKVNGGATSPAIVAGLTPVAKKRGRPKKEATIPTATVASAEEVSMMKPLKKRPLVQQQHQHNAFEEQKTHTQPQTQAPGSGGQTNCGELSATNQSTSTLDE